eukprot:2467188-Pyramimonas_sp.AAC.1
MRWGCAENALRLSVTTVGACACLYAVMRCSRPAPFWLAPSHHSFHLAALSRSAACLARCTSSSASSSSPLISEIEDAADDNSRRACAAVASSR